MNDAEVFVFPYNRTAFDVVNIIAGLGLLLSPTNISAMRLKPMPHGMPGSSVLP